MVGCFKYPMFFPYEIIHNYLYWFSAWVSEADAGMRMMQACEFMQLLLAIFAVIIYHSDLA